MHPIFCPSTSYSCLNFVLHKLGPYQLEMGLFGYNPYKWPYKCVFLWLFHPSYNWFLGTFQPGLFQPFQVSYLKVKSACLMAYSRNFVLISGASQLDVLRQGKRRKTWLFPRMAETSFFNDPPGFWLVRIEYQQRSPLEPWVCI